MDGPLFCCIMLTKYLFILFLDNIGARLTYPSYETSFNLKDIEYPGPYYPIEIIRNLLHVENMKFSIRRGGITLRTVGILPSVYIKYADTLYYEGEVYLGDSFIQGNPIRSIRVVNGTSTNRRLLVHNRGEQK
ncbi:hypothetical protein KSF78_0009767 [Schistosoma japonicum]|nr:hypothetical protein KSF78_0009767 [Schistosoma japonicum]